MKNNNIFIKIKKFFKNLFNKTKALPLAENIEYKEEKVIAESNKLSKEQFFDLYEKLKKGDVDIFTIDPDEVEKMCILLEEETKFKEKLLTKRLAEINEIDNKTKELKIAM